MNIIRKIWGYFKEFINGGLYAFSFVGLLNEIESWEYGILFQFIGILSLIFGYVLIMLFVLIPHGLLFSITDSIKETREDLNNMKDKTGRYGALGMIIVAVISGVGSLSDFFSNVNYLKQSYFFILSVIAIAVCISIARNNKIDIKKLKPLNIKQGVVIFIGAITLSFTSTIFSVIPQSSSNFGFASICLVIICIEAIMISKLFNKYII